MTSRISNMGNNVCVISWIFLGILTSVLTRANNDSSKKHLLVKIECKYPTPDEVLMMSIGVVNGRKSGRLAWISKDKIEVDYTNFIHVEPYATGYISQRPAHFSVLLTDFNPEVGATFNCSVTTSRNGNTHIQSHVITPVFIDEQNYGKSVDDYCASDDTTPFLIAVIILAVIVLFLTFVVIKFICLDQGRCRALYSPMLPRYSDHTYSYKDDNYNFSQGNNHYSEAWNGRSTTASSKEGGSRMMLGSSKSLSKSNFPYRAHNGSVRSMPPRMPQPPPPPPPPLPRDGPRKKLPAHQSNGSLQSSVTYALPQDAIDEELPTPPQDSIDQEQAALPKDVTELGLPATGEEDGTDVSSEHYKVPKDSSVNRLSCSL